MKYSLYLNGAIWLFFALLSFFGLNSGIPASPQMGFLCGGILLCSLFPAVRFGGRWYYLILAELLLFLLFILSGQFGPAVPVVLASHLLSLVLVAGELKKRV